MKNTAICAITGLLMLPVIGRSQTVLNGASSLSLVSGKEEKREKAEGEKYDDRQSANLGTAVFNTKDKSIDLNYYGYFTPKRFTHFFVGLTGGGAAKNSVATILSNKNIVGEGNATLRAGFRIWYNHTRDDVYDNMLEDGDLGADAVQHILDHQTRPAADLWLVATAGVTGSSFKHFIPDSGFSKQIEKENFTGRQGNVGFNYWRARFLGGTILFGSTIGIKYADNFGDLDESTSEDVRTITDPSTGIVRTVTTKETVYQGTYTNDNITYPLNIDFYYAPHKLEKVGFLLNSSTIFSDDIPKTKVGFGVFMLKDKDPFNPVAGITFGFSDVFNADKKDDYKGSINKFSIALTTRINIVNSQKRE